MQKLDQGAVYGAQAVECGRNGLKGFNGLNRWLWIVSAMCIIMAIYLSRSNLAILYAGDQSLWEEYKSYFISEDGRMIDYYNGQISHSEGQGYGMLLAVLYDDMATFGRLWHWTIDNLGVRNDHLFAWKWGKRHNGKWEVVDFNNATDGDILIAYSLLLAEKKWPGHDYKAAGLKIIKGLRENLAVNWKEYTYLLPGYYGFIKEDGFVANPGYLIFPAYRYFAEVDEKAFWEKVYNDGLLLIAKGRFGKLRLAADWVILNEAGISIFPERPPYSGYEAIRVMLYLSWGDEFLFPEGLKNILDIYKRLGYMPLWVDLANEGISLTPAPGGFYAIYARAAEKIGEHALSERLLKEAMERLDRNDYYSFSLYLLATGVE